MAPLTHIVIFQYKGDTTKEQKESIAVAFLALRGVCLSPGPLYPDFTVPGVPYIQSITAGSNNSSEKAAEGYEVSSAIVRSTNLSLITSSMPTSSLSPLPNKETTTSM